MASWKEKAQALRIQLAALVYAYRDRRTPWYARVWVAILAAYAFSPIDLIPDFIPVLGYLDDFVLIPLGVLLALKMIPAQVMVESRVKANEALDAERPEFKFMAWVVIGMWVLAIALVGWVVVKGINP